MVEYVVIERKYPVPDMREWKEGMTVVSRFNMSDYGGEPFGVGEQGVIVKATRSTIHVKDPRGHVHRGRYRESFNLEAE